MIWGHPRWIGNLMKPPYNVGNLSRSEYRMFKRVNFRICHNSSQNGSVLIGSILGLCQIRCWGWMRKTYDQHVCCWAWHCALPVKTNPYWNVTSNNSATIQVAKHNAYWLGMLLKTLCRDVQTWNIHLYKCRIYTCLVASRLYLIYTYI